MPDLNTISQMFIPDLKPTFQVLIPDWPTVIWSILTSILASYLFWLYSFKLSRTNIHFSGVIERSKSTGEDSGIHRYRVKIINSGARDLIDISFLVKLSIKQKNDKGANYTFLGCGNDNQIPILLGKKSQKKLSGTSCATKLTLFPTQTTLNEYKKTFYRKDIQRKANDGTLSLDDILDAYGHSCKIIIYAFGSDSVTGARKMFVSPTYTMENIKSGLFLVAQPIKTYRIPFLGYRQYINDSLAFEETTHRPPIQNQKH